MFVRTYGLMYEQNADIFIDLFTNLRRSYDASAAAAAALGRHGGGTTVTAAAATDSDVDVRRSLDRFFVVLMRRMLTLLNQHGGAPPSDRFLYCVSSRIDQLRPFGDVPDKLSVQLHRAFITARAFIVGLKTGNDVIATLSQVRRHFACL